MNDTRFTITPEVLREQHPIVIWQSYPVEEVAKIAAGCAGRTPQERILEALKLLAAAEDIATWTPWTEQDLQREKGDGLGDISDLQKEQVMFELWQQIPEIIAAATDAAGSISRKELCKIACVKAGRKSPKGDERPLSEDSIGRIFLEEWLPLAADSHARWTLFRQMKSDMDQDRSELRTAIETGLSKAKISELQKKIRSTEAQSFEGGGEFWPSASAVEGRRGKLTNDEKDAERETFRLSLEQGTHNQPRIVISAREAHMILHGTNEFTGFLEFVRFPVAKPKYVPALPPLRGVDGAFAKLERREKGKFKSIRDDSEDDEASVPALPNGQEKCTDGKKWIKRR